MSADDLRSIAFVETSSTAHELSYVDCFGLAARLAQSLESKSAAVIFDDLAGLFDDIAPPDSASDGSFETVATPPSDNPSCIAGLVWAALGDMSGKVRWQAAHAVLLLVKLGCREVLAALRRLADGSASASAFVDARFTFYSLHARQWLLLAIARAACEPDPTPLSDFTDWLVEVVRSEGHAANQVLAQRALTELTRSGALALSSSDIDVLSASVMPQSVEMEWNERKDRPNPLQACGDDDVTEDHLFFLDFDTWCGNLADVFGSYEHDVMRRAGQVATSLDGYAPLVLRTDPRREAGVYSDSRNYSHHGSWPEEEPLDFYIAVHALLTVGAELASTCIAYQEPGRVEDAYTEWLARFLPARRDGRWLADRRDGPPSPNPAVVLTTAGAAPEWPWNMSKRDFEVGAGIGGEWVTVFSRVNNEQPGLSEDIQIESALVPPATAQALLVAMQTMPLGGFALPDTESYDYPDGSPFELVPWLDPGRSNEGLEELDERSGQVGFPPSRPGANVIRQFALTSDVDMREWSTHGTTVFRSRVWRDIARRSSNRDEGTTGGVLTVRKEFLNTMLQSRGMNLVLQVAIRRQHVRPYYERQKDRNDDLGWLDWSRKTYLLDPEGRWHEY
jgi:hypothetical protein